MRTTEAAAATTASPTSRRPPRRAASRFRAPFSRTRGCVRRRTSWPIRAGAACVSASTSRSASGRACPRARWPRPGRTGPLVDCRAELLRLGEPALHVGPRRLLHTVVADQALLEQRRQRTRVAALPAGPHPEFVQRPVERAAEPRLGGEDAELEVDPLLLERVRALLLGRAIAVGLRAELGDHDRLVRIALAHGVEGAGGLRGVEDLAARTRVPAEVVVDPEHVQGLI